MKQPFHPLPRPGDLVLLNLSPPRGQFGFLLRRAAADLLDIQEERELKVGLRVLRDAVGDIVGQIFVSDTLENGAGYASLLGQPAVTETLLQYVVGQSSPTFYGFLVSPQHAGGGNACLTSCPDCLRDFSNLSYHRARGRCTW